MKTDNLNKLITEALAIEAEEAKEAGALGFMARALVQATLPHSRVEGNEFERKNGAFALNILAPSKVGLPYGSIPRLLMAWISTEATKTKNRELVLGDNLSDFMRQLDLVPTGGRWGTITRLKTQTNRLFSSTISMRYSTASQTAGMSYGLADKWVLWWDAPEPGQTAIFESTVRLSEPFYEEIVNSPVPIDMRALKALKRSPMALDIYCWATYRTSYLKRKTEIPWQALQLQFGADYKRTRAFKEKFLEALKKVELVYPELKADTGAKGLVLKPSSTHIKQIR